MTSHDEAHKVRPVLIIPVGSWEQHGPHLPFDTDTQIAVELGQRLLSARPHHFLAPPVTVTASGEHSGFEGTLSIGTRTTTDVLVELVRSATWAHRVIFINGHGGNSQAISDALKILTHDQHKVLFWSPPCVDNTDTHAGHTETSVMLIISPKQVDMSRATSGDTRPLKEIIGTMRTHGVKAVSANGILGDPRTANAEAGLHILDTWTQSLLTACDQWV